MSFPKGKLRRVFGIDPRSLAALRMAVGMILLVDLAIRAADLRALYSDDGVVPSDRVREFYGPWRWSLHFLNGSIAFQATLFVVAAVFAAALLAGYRTRLATIGAWALTVSLQARLPLVNNAGDILLRLLLFWGMFLPLGRRWSLDARRRAATRPDEISTGDRPIVSIASAALLVQVALMYFFTGLHKSNDVWLTGQGLHYALSLDCYGRPLGQTLLEYPALLEWLSLGTLGLELLGPLVVFIPFRTAAIRLAVIALFAALHVGIELCLTVGLFSYVSLAAWTAFVPGEFWPLVGRAPHAMIPPRPQSPPQRWFGVRSTPYAVLCGLTLAYVIWWNVADLPEERFWVRVPMPTEVTRLGRALHIDQKWDMFARPSQNDGWYIAAATLHDGRTVDVLREGAAVDLDAKPSRVAAMFPNHRWRKFYRNLTLKKFESFRPLAAEHLCRVWNESHGPDEQILSFVLYYTQETTLPGNEEPTPVTFKMHELTFGSPEETGNFIDALRKAEGKKKGDPLLP